MQSVLVIPLQVESPIICPLLNKMDTFQHLKDHLQ